MKNLSRTVTVDLDKLLPMYESKFDDWIKYIGIDKTNMMLACKMAALNDIGVITDEEFTKIQNYFIDKIIDHERKERASVDAQGFDWSKGDFVW